MTKSIKARREAPNPAIFPHKFQNDQEMWLHWSEWWPKSCAAKDVKGVLFLTSGLAEHSQRYDGVAEEIAEELEFAVFCLDHQGHGLSEGKRKYVDKFAFYINDYCQFLMTVFAKYSSSGNKYNIDISQKPRFLLGHSMGGLIALHTARQCARGIPERYVTASASSSPLQDNGKLTFNGLILSGPAIKPDPSVATPTKQKLARMLSDWAPTMGLGNLDIDTLSSNHQVVENAKNDVLFAKEPLRARWGYEMLVAMNDVQTNAETFLNFPLLLIHGEKDTICLPAGSEDFFAKAGPLQNKKFVLFKGMKHEIMNEINNAEVRAEVKDFIRKEMNYAPSEIVVVDVAAAKKQEAAAGDDVPVVPNSPTAAESKKSNTGC